MFSLAYVLYAADSRSVEVRVMMSQLQKRSDTPLGSRISTELSMIVYTT